MNATAQRAPSQDKRQNERVTVRLAGKLFVPAEEVTLECSVVNLSAGGAGLHCPEPPPLDAFVVLYVDGFGRFDCVTTRFVKGELGLKFICKDTKRKRLERDLSAFVQEGMKGVTRLRRYQREASHEITKFTNPAGQDVVCELIDISFQGAQLKTSERPVIGSIIQLGQTRGWVVRHLENGIGVQFQQRLETIPGLTHGR